MSKYYENNAETIGGTPLVKINHISDGNILAKLENRNPAMSVKCRIGANMVVEGERDGSLKPGMTIVEPTSGNTGIALAFVAAAKGYDCILTMPNTMSLERRMLMKSMGAEVILTDGAKGVAAAIARAEEIIASDPKSTGVRTNSKTRPIQLSTSKPRGRKSGRTQTAASIFWYQA